MHIPMHMRADMYVRARTHMRAYTHSHAPVKSEHIHVHKDQHQQTYAHCIQRMLSENALATAGAPVHARALAQACARIAYAIVHALACTSHWIAWHCIAMHDIA
jgi:hypothetical protein